MAETMTIAKMHETRKAIKHLLGEFYPARLPVHMKLIRNQMDLAEQGPVAALEEVLEQLEAVGQEQANCVTVWLLIAAALEIGEEQGLFLLPTGRLSAAQMLDRRPAEIVPIRRVACHG